MVRKEHERHEKKLRKQLDKQQKKLAQKGIHVDLETLKREYLAQRGLLGREQVQNFFLYFFYIKDISSKCALDGHLFFCFP